MPRPPASRKTVRTAPVRSKAPALSETARPPQSLGKLDLDLLPSTVGYFLRRLQLSYKDHFLENTPELEMAPKDVGALFILARNPGISPTQFGAAMALDGAMTSLLLAALERRGLLKREKSTEDGRARIITLTKEGTAMITKLRRTVSRVDGAFTAGLSEAERAQLLGLMGRLLASRTGGNEPG
ncbi:MAG TPA: MarR family transcriptional regulator [Variovorax sp.]|nr:MarR family transcriptional regulator [Variovorax sp.]